MVDDRVFIGVDLALKKTGLVAIKNGKTIDQAIICFDKKVTSEHDRILRCLHVARDILEFIKKFDKSIVYLEGVGASSKFGRFGTQIYIIEMHGVLKTNIFLNLKKTPIIVPPPSWKKLILGNGRAKKDEIVKIFNAMNVFFEHQDLYDAYGVAQFGYQRGKT